MTSTSRGGGVGKCDVIIGEIKNPAERGFLAFFLGNNLDKVFV